MYDRFNRKIDYLRLSVTDRCNLRCVYCRPAEGLNLTRTTRILSLETLGEIAAEAVALGVTKVRLTGGEPLVRKNIVTLVEMIARIPGLTDFAMTTNATLLSRFAPQLKAAGLHRVNISLDSLDPETFRQVTRVGRLEDVLEGIEAALAAGLTPVKVNCVVEQSSDEPDARMVRDFCLKKGLVPRFIRRMNLETGDFHVVEGGTGGDCSRCGRLRVTSQGLILPCLFSDLGFDIREHGIRQALELAVRAKPPSGKTSHRNTFLSVGG